MLMVGEQVDGGAGSLAGLKEQTADRPWFAFPPNRADGCAMKTILIVVRDSSWKD
jgi:hypothetical protein